MSDEPPNGVEARERNAVPDIAPSMPIGAPTASQMGAVAEAILDEIGGGAVRGLRAGMDSLPYEMRAGMAAGKRAEDVAMCVVLMAEDVAGFERVPAAPGNRTLDWHVDLADGRCAAVEVTHKQTDWRYRSFLNGGFAATGPRGGKLIA